MSEFKAKWMCVSARRAGATTNQIRSIIERAMGASATSLNIEVTCPEIETLREKNLRMVEALKSIYGILDNIKSDLCARVYTTTEDEFQSIYHARDIADEALAQSPKSQALMEVGRAKNNFISASLAHLDTIWDDERGPSNTEKEMEKTGKDYFEAKRKAEK